MEESEPPTRRRIGRRSPDHVESVVPVERPSAPTRSETPVDHVDASGETNGPLDRVVVSERARPHDGRFEG
jgi:hypothetical protein